MITMGALTLRNAIDNKLIEKNIKSASQQSELNTKVLAPLVDCLNNGTARTDCMIMLVTKAERDSEQDNLAEVFFSDENLLQLLTDEQKAKLSSLAKTQ
jgi:hypothetical protein